MTNAICRHRCWSNLVDLITENLRMKQRPVPLNWQAVLQEHRPWLRKVLRCRVSDKHAVEDLLQDLALSVVKQVKSNPDNVPAIEERVAPWLYRIAVRQAINHYRRKGRKSAPQVVDNLDGFDRNVEPVDWLMSLELHESVRTALRQLPDRDREILVLKYTENWSYRDLADHLGVQPRTIEYRLVKAKEKMRRLLAGKVENSRQPK